ncbi:polysaccharide deacetylase family protein [Rubellicoccus peritrichatus]|uniref:Polysaccharide deacetylase family protein n=1 Tax=Rubellicoccus peritrichatus TaxID=3080537 RepID=A0AAQ3QQ17_9BACT|nr:polysaccharide deacetylase family protein [Puniceicoccus sp. CR14]WOO39728.1 polysaccharide deacetylase family protein [Puniceicoccus sp. CR14]
MNRILLAGVSITTLLVSSLIGVQAADRVWRWSWPEFNGPEPVAEVCDFKYGKRWVYSVDIDDTPLSNYTISFPVLSEYHFTDAPPGIAGGNRKPFVGNAAIYAARINPTDEIYNWNLLSWGQIQEMCEAGWGIANHAYTSAAYGLTEEQLREEIYWNQVLIGWYTPNRRATNYFVYPSGDTAYRPYLADYGILAGGIQGGPPTNINSSNLDWTDLKRINLDEPVWSQSDDPYVWFPDPPKDGDVFVDFTHWMETDPEHPNRVRWSERLGMIESLYGEHGADDVWSTSIDEAVAYDVARHNASVDVSNNQVTLTLGGNAPSTSLTLKITGIPESVPLTAPKDGLLYRQGDVVWVTTPSLGGPVGSRLPSPNLRCIYNGPVKDLDWPETVELAGVRILQHGGKADETISVDVVEPDGELLEIGSSTGTLWAVWMLFASVPNEKPWSAKGLRVTGNTNAHKKMEVWAVDPINAWRENYFQNRDSSGDAEDYADCDGDQFSNFAEYAFCSDPRDSSSRPIALAVEPTSDKALGIEILCRAGLVVPTYTAEYSLDMKKWTVGGELDGAPFDNGDGTLTARFRSPAALHRFLRVFAN